jgi:probable HAF family extracellular repeat protein
VDVQIARRGEVARCSVVLLAASLWLSSPYARAAARFSVTDLGPFMAHEVDERPGLNRSAHVASWQVVEQTHVVAALLGDGAELQLVAGMPPTANGFSFGINDAGWAVGIFESRQDLRFTQAFSYRDENIRILPSLGGASAAARAINGHGLVVGNAETGGTGRHEVHAVTWTNNEVHDLGTLRSGNFSRAFDVTESGIVAGEANESPDGKVRAVLWSHGKIKPLGLLPQGSFSSAQAVNEKGMAVGYADDEDGGARAVLFSHNRITDLGSFGDEPNSALGINDKGQIVGSSPIAEGKMRGFLWESGHLYDLNQLILKNSGWLLLGAYRVNATGQILAYGFYAGRTHLCLLTPVHG